MTTFMIRSMFTFSIIVMLSIPLTSHAQTIPLSPTIQIEAGKTATFPFDLKEIPKGKQIQLVLDGRIVAPNLGGNTGAVSVSVNGQPVVGRNLLNKPLRFTMREGSQLDWTTRDSSYYRLMYSPDYSNKIKTDESFIYGLFEPEQEPYRFVWDITSLVHVGTNSVLLDSCSGLSFALDFRDIGIEIGKPIPSRNAGAAVQPAPTGQLPVYVPVYRAKAPASIEVSQNGNIRFVVNGRVFNIRSRTSLPDGKWNDGVSSKDIWKPLKTGKSITAKWQGFNYKVERKITLPGDHISISDTVRNTGTELVGVILENRLRLPGNPEKIMLCGSGGGMKQRSNAAHPTAMAQFKDLAIGLAAEDDILRFHANFFEEPNTIGLSDPSLGIPAGKSQKLEWSIYITPNGDYWDFVNAIRRNWGSNFTLQGPLVFPDADIWNYIRGVNFTADDLRKWLGKMNNSVKMVMTYNAMSPDIAISTSTIDRPAYKHGTAILDAKAWQDMTRQLAKEMKIADPTVKVYAYTHKNLCTEVGYPQKYRDSVAMDPAGNPVTSVYTPTPGLFVPLIGNSYGKAMMDVYKLIVENLDSDVYIDEINNDYLVPGDGDKVWDGCTVVIDPKTHSIIRKQSNPSLLVLPWLSNLMEYFHSKGKSVYFNGYITSRTMLSWGKRGFLQTSVEDGMGFSSITNEHLGTPLAWAGYMTGRPGYDHFHESINYGGIPFTRSGPWNDHTFPITLLNLKAGIIIGKERILTTLSGQYGWNDNSKADVYVYDGKGNLVEKPYAKTIRKAGKVLTELRMPSDYTAVMVRK